MVLTLVSEQPAQVQGKPQMLPLKSHMSKEEPRMVSWGDQQGRKSMTVEKVRLVIDVISFETICLYPCVPL